MSNWLDDEIDEILQENEQAKEVLEKKKNLTFARNQDNRYFCLFLIFLIPLFASHVFARENIKQPVSELSASWRCKKCKNNIYSENADWNGDFYCPRCGTKKGASHGA